MTICPSTTFHEQVLLRAHGREAPVDVGIRDLIEELWGKGYNTLFSCQGGPSTPEGVQEHGYMAQPPYIVFATPEQAMLFAAEYGGRLDVPGEDWSPLQRHTGIRTVRDFPIGGKRVEWEDGWAEGVRRGWW